MASWAMPDRGLSRFEWMTFVDFEGVLRRSLRLSCDLAGPPRNAPPNWVVSTIFAVKTAVFACSLRSVRECWDLFLGDVRGASKGGFVGPCDWVAIH